MRDEDPSLRYAVRDAPSRGKRSRPWGIPSAARDLQKAVNQKYLEESWSKKQWKRGNARISTNLSSLTG